MGRAMPSVGCMDHTVCLIKSVILLAMVYHWKLLEGALYIELGDDENIIFVMIKYKGSILNFKLINRYIR